jgi:hypothetical protein
VVAFILVFAVFFTFWWSQYYFENKSQGLGLLAAFSGYRNQQIFTSTTTKAVNKAKEGLTSSLQTTAELVTVEGTTPVANPNDRLFLFSGVDVEGEQSTTTTPKKQQQQQNRMSDVDPSDNDAPPSIEVSQLYDLLEHGRQVRVFEVFGSEREETSR